MNKIEVPDWVVEVGAKALYETSPGCNWANLKEIYRDVHRAEAKAAITAALGDWVVPVGWMDPDDGSLVCEYHEHEPRYVSYTQPLFALRQEKPE